MGLWNFVKSAGKAIGIGEAKADEVDQSVVLKDEVKNLGLDAEGLEVTVEGDTVKVSGTAKNQEEKEKAILALGNIEGVANVDEDVSVPDAAEPVFHTVEKGDTLWAIAAKHLGDGSKYPEIFEANRPMLSDPDKIYPGQMLRIPQS